MIGSLNIYVMRNSEYGVLSDDDFLIDFIRYIPILLSSSQKHTCFLALKYIVYGNLKPNHTSIYTDNRHCEGSVELWNYQPKFCDESI